MAQTKAKTSKKPAAATPVKTPMRREIGAAVCLLLSVYLFACFFNGGPWLTQPRAALRWLIGAGFYVLPFALFADAAILCFHRGKPVRLRVICSLCFPVAVGFLWTDLGLTGKAAAWLSERLLPWFVKLIFALVGILLLVFVFGKTVARLVSSYRARERAQYTPAPEPAFEPRIPRRRPKKSEIDIPIDDAPPVRRRVEPYAASPPEEEPPRRPRRDNDIPLDIPFMEDNGTPKRAPRRKPAAPATFADEEPYNKADDGYSFPPAELLASGGGVAADGTEEVRVNTERLEATFRSFGVNVGISNATRGPSVTRYEAELEAGVKLSRLTNLADDIALSLGASGVRIGPMPDRISTVGIEVPNKSVSTVFLRELIESPEFRTAPGKLSFAIGKNISGDCIVGNIAKLPHLLVAGTTGSGKSVCLNSLILSILYKATPDEVRFIMIDPKMVEFRIFNGIPHLLVPVVTDVKKASGALQWAVIEMEKRYR
ncbi:MAG: DNA translocase FtsK, partial [Oscillospiraceae bacterium]|nr:DNA translocase FtsK [Oscillospiraceae bacterium]